MASPVDSIHSAAWDESMLILEPAERQVLFKVLSSFFQYRKWAHQNTTHVRRQNFYALPQAHWALLANPPFSFLDTLNLVDDAIDKNADLAEAILQHALLNFQLPLHPEPNLSNDWRQGAKTSDLEKVRTTIRQFYRDWSEEGSSERDASLGRVIQALQDERSARIDSGPMKVLVPGSGLSRLLFELCRDGFNVSGNEISYHMLIASSYILNGGLDADAHAIYPWIHGFSNHQTRDAHLLQVKIPDVCVSSAIASAGTLGSMTMGGGDFVGVYGKEEQKDAFDAVACVFFLDTAPNIIRYLETINNCLRTGGLLVNFGPLLWHFEHRGPPAEHQHPRHNRTGDSSRQREANGTNGVNGSNLADRLNGLSASHESNGANGLNGSDDEDRMNGLSVSNATNGVHDLNGSHVLNSSNGLNGLNGVNGSNGTQGLNGVNGLNDTHEMEVEFEMNNDFHDQGQPYEPDDAASQGLAPGVSDGLPNPSNGSLPADDGIEVDESPDPGTMSPGSIELTNDEVLQLVEKFGFEVIKTETGIKAPYLDHPSGMMPTIYNASFWVARKL